MAGMLFGVRAVDPVTFLAVPGLLLIAAAAAAVIPGWRAAGVEPIVLQAHFGGGFHHPHLRGTTVRDWPLNVFSDEDAASQLSILRAIASSDLHNLVYRADYRIVPAVNRTQVRD